MGCLKVMQLFFNDQQDVKMIWMHFLIFCTVYHIFPNLIALIAWLIKEKYVIIMNQLE